MVCWLPERRLHARFQHPSAGRRPANSTPAVPVGELTRFLWCEPSSTACFDQSPRRNWRDAAPKQMIATLLMLHLDGWASAQPRSQTDRTANALSATHLFSTLP